MHKCQQSCLTSVGLLAWMGGFFFSLGLNSLMPSLPMTVASPWLYLQKKLCEALLQYDIQKEHAGINQNMVHVVSHFDMNKALVAERGAQRRCWRKLGSK